MIIPDSTAVEILETAHRALDSIERRAGSPQTGVSNVNINAGGVGVWISTCCCAVMLGISIIGAAVIIDQGRRISDLNDYLAAIYMQAPHLRPDSPDKEGAP